MGTPHHPTYGGIFFPWLRRWRIASRPISSGSVNQANQASNIGVRYLDAFLDETGISSAYVVAHDWGSGLAFHLAAHRPEFIRGLAFMEFIRPMPSWNDFHADQVETFRKFRTPGMGEKMILDENLFIEGVLPGATARKLTAEEMAVYRAPFPTPESRRSTWRLPNDLPIAEEPADVYAATEEAHRALARSSYPKLLFVGNPGALINPAFADSFAKSLKSCRVVQLKSGLHYLQEDTAGEGEGGHSERDCPCTAELGTILKRYSRP
jgi:haloalkane dehalogenase